MVRERVPKLRAWMFRITLPSEYQYDDETAKEYFSTLWEPSYEKLNSLKYIVFQLEKGADTEKYHLQGYAELRKPVEASWILENWPHFASEENSTDLRPRLFGTREKCIDYCKKEETRIAGPWEYGANYGQGARSDLFDVANEVLAGTDIVDIMLNHPSTYLKYSKHIKAMKYDVNKHMKIDWKICVIVFWGDSNSGKTFTIKKLAGEKAFHYMAGQHNTSWWDDYYGQEDVVFNDWGHGGISLREFQLLVDGEMTIAVKNGTTKAIPKRIWISSNFGPETWYSKMDATSIDRKSIYRRLDYVFKWTGDYNDHTVQVVYDKKPGTYNPITMDMNPWKPSIDPHENAPVFLFDRIPWNEIYEKNLARIMAAPDAPYEMLSDNPRVDDPFEIEMPPDSPIIMIEQNEIPDEVLFGSDDEEHRYSGYCSYG